MASDRTQRIADLFLIKDDEASAGKAVSLKGWIRTNRDNGHIGFMELNDGSCFSGCQIVYDMDRSGGLREATKFLTGCSVEVSGTYVRTPDGQAAVRGRGGGDFAPGRMRSRFPDAEKTALAGIPP